MNNQVRLPHANPQWPGGRRRIRPDRELGGGSYGSAWSSNRELHKQSVKDEEYYPELWETWTNRRRRNEDIVEGRGGVVDPETLARATRSHNYETKGECRDDQRTFFSDGRPRYPYPQFLVDAVWLDENGELACFPYRKPAYLAPIEPDIVIDSSSDEEMEIDLRAISLDEEDEENRPGPSNAQALASNPHNIVTASPVPTKNSIARDRKASGSSGSHRTEYKLEDWPGSSLETPKAKKTSAPSPAVRLLNLEHCTAINVLSEETMQITDALKLKGYRLEGREIEMSPGKARMRKVMIDAEEFGQGAVVMEIRMTDGHLFTLKGSKLWINIYSLANDQLWKRPISEVEEDLRPLINPITFAGVPRTHRPHVRHDRNFDTMKLKVDERIAESIYLDSQTGPSAIQSVGIDPRALSARRTPALTYDEDGHFSPIRLFDYALINSDPSARISAGDHVVVNSEYGTRWYAKVAYIFQVIEAGESPLQLHVQWLLHGRDGRESWLGLSANPLRLFWNGSCDSILADSITHKIDIRQIPVSESAIPSKTAFSYAYAYFKGSRAYTDIPVDSGSYPLCDGKNRPGCICCEKTLEDELEGGATESAPLESGEITAKSGTKYHINDTVFLLPATGQGRLLLGIILEVLKPIDGSAQKLKIREVDRVDALKDEREVSLSSTTRTVLIDQLQGRFNLFNIKELGISYSKNTQPSAQPEEILARDMLEREKNPVFFWTSDAVKKLICPICSAEVREEWRKDMHVRQMVEDNPEAFGIGTADVYAGVGGLDIGISAGHDAIKLKFCSDIAPAATESLSINFPTAEVRTEAAADVVKSWRDSSDDEVPQIRLVVGGPPCQGFSYANKYKPVMDPRSLEPYVFMSAIAVLRPWFAVMENVRAITDFKIASPDDPTSRATCVSVLTEMALDLGYQCRDGILQAAAYGTPQKRSRYFLVMAMRGQILPTLPQPTHSLGQVEGLTSVVTQYNLPWNKLKAKDFADRSLKKKFADLEGDRADRSIRSFKFGYHFPTLFPDAIRDLPAFEYEVPDEGFDENRRKFGPRPSATAGHFLGYPDGTEYHPSSQNNFQRLMRATNQDRLALPLKNHVVLQPSKAEIVHRWCGVGVKGQILPRTGSPASGNYLDIEHKYKPSLPPAFEKNSAKDTGPFWARIKFSELLTTVRTTLNGDGYSHGPRLHLEQRRLISVREFARSQGIPDSIQFGDLTLENGSYNSQQYRDTIKLIGNAVPYLVARAIGLQLRPILNDLILESTFDAEGKVLTNPGYARFDQQAKDQKRLDRLWEDNYRLKEHRLPSATPSATPSLSPASDSKPSSSSLSRSPIRRSTFGTSAEMDIVATPERDATRKRSISVLELSSDEDD